MTPMLLPLYVHPSADPAAWHAVAAAASHHHNGSEPGSLTVVVDQPAGVPDPQLSEAVTALAAAGITALGRVDAAYATRPLAEFIDDVARWSDQPVVGVFLDRAPTSSFCLGPVSLAARVARRDGLALVVLNPGVPTDPLYRDLGTAICSFEGSWWEYRRWPGEGSQPGDGHLVHSVPPAALPAARELLRQRRAGFGLVTDRTPPAPYTGAPGWLLTSTGLIRGERISNVST